MVETDLKYAGFWKRFAAYLIDSFLLFIVKTILFVPFWIFTAGFWINLGNWKGTEEYVSVSRNFNDPQNFTQLIVVILILIFLGTIFFLIQWLYFAIMESSKHQATVGKIVLRIKVTDIFDRRISFGKASGRFFGKILSGLFLMFGFIMAAFTEKKQALHDMLASCLVVNSDYDKYGSINEEIK
ncbi:MAG: RDD family protein [Melioribacteraceae bacterium]|nr:RDD family protein [Melioribacteraceae bacterium]